MLTKEQESNAVGLLEIFGNHQWMRNLVRESTKVDFGKFKAAIGSRCPSARMSNMHDCRMKKCGDNTVLSVSSIFAFSRPIQLRQKIDI